ncbi:MAG: metallophosphoesterase [Cytophagales bacterium]|nr:metallophosphoesterase [Cytophagales bacterium]
MGLFAIGDIHGTSGALQTLLDQPIFGAEDTIVFLGDYVNKGPDVKGTIERLIDFSKDHQAIFLKGNHEIMMLQARNNQNLLPQWLFSGGDTTLDAYQIGDMSDWHLRIPQEHWDFLESCQPYYASDGNIFVHAGLESGVPLNEQHRVNLYWKSYPEPKPYVPNKTVICGHTSRKNGLIADFGHTICIDTFAWGGQWLTCLELESRQYWQTRENGEIRKGSLDQ